MTRALITCSERTAYHQQIQIPQSFRDVFGHDVGIGFYFFNFLTKVSMMSVLFLRTSH